MTIPFNKDDMRFSITILDNYYNESDEAPKAFFFRIFKTLAGAQDFADIIINNPKVELSKIGISLSEDQLMHFDDVHLVVREDSNIILDKTASTWSW